VSPADEAVEWVDDDGQVIEVVTRSRVRAEGLLHRCTYVVVLDAADEVLVHRRARWKDVYPGWWDLAFGGVCAPGEGWEAAARRELAEEAGLRAPLADLGPVRYDGADGRVLGRLFLARHEGPAVPRDGEVVETGWVPRSRLAAWAAERPVCRDSATVVLPLVVAGPAAWSTAADRSGRPGP
jgi:8-oxo-dGTP pyrophosphatase MutT (NUDIX family)